MRLRYIRNEELIGRRSRKYHTAFLRCKCNSYQAGGERAEQA
jgi:hypothetical protein